MSSELIDAAEAVSGFDVSVAVPATSANMGPGYDSFGFAVDVCDVVRARLVDEVDPAERVTVTGCGAEALPRDGSHLILRIAESILAERGIVTSGRLVLDCENVIPHSRGMGSSAAAAVAGIVVADALTAACGLPRPTVEERLRRATAIEGHPDNAAPAIFGGITVSTMRGDEPVSASLPVSGDLACVLVVPDERLDTEVARSLLPEQIPHAAAAANSAAAGLLVHAVCHDPSLLFDATIDRLHQEYRRPAMPRTLERVDALRAAGLAAVVSGAGPTVAVLGAGADLESAVRRVLSGDDAQILAPGIAEAGAAVVEAPAP